MTQKNEIERLQAAKASVQAFLDGLKRPSVTLGKPIPTYIQLNSELQDLYTDALVSYSRTNSFVEDATQDVREERKMGNAHKRRLYRNSPEENRLYFAALCKTFDLEIDDRITALEKEFFKIRTLQVRNPNIKDYENLMNDIKTELKKQDNEMPVEHFFKEGPEDTALVGQYLILRQEEWSDSTIRHVVSIIGSMKWLIAMKVDFIDEKEQPIITTAFSEPQSSEDNGLEVKSLEISDDFKKAFKTLLVDCLKLNNGKTKVDIGDRKWGRYNVLAAVMYVLKDRKVLPTTNIMNYASLIRSCLDGMPDTLRQAINKSILKIKPYECSLKKLSVSFIKASPNRSNINAMTAVEYTTDWDGLYELIDTFIDTNNKLESLRGTPNYPQYKS